MSKLESILPILESNIVFIRRKKGDGKSCPSKDIDPTQAQLDFLLDAVSNTIGALLLHFAAVEYAYQVTTFEKRDLNEEELSEWGPALEIGCKRKKRFATTNRPTIISCGSMYSKTRSTTAAKSE